MHARRRPQPTAIDTSPACNYDEVRGSLVPTKTDNIRFALLVVAILSAVLPGCAPDEGGLPPELESGKAIMPASNRPKSNGADYALLVQMRLGTIEVPVGIASGSEEIWSYLDEEAIEPVHAANLGRNGLRVGLGRKDNWADMAKIFERMTGRTVAMKDMLLMPGNPAPLTLKRAQPVQTIFIFYDDRTLSGADFVPGDNLFVITCTVNEDDVSTVFLTGVPQVRTSARRPRVVNESGRFTMVAKPDVFPLTPLTFRVPVVQGDFVVIGPGSAATRSVTAGHHFLVKKKEGVEFETVLVLFPRSVLAATR